jgi:hypothetical protein
MAVSSARPSRRQQDEQAAQQREQRYLQNVPSPAFGSGVIGPTPP